MTSLKFTRTLDVALTEEEIAQRANELAEATTRATEIDSKVEHIKAEAKARLDEERGVALSVHRQMRKLADEIVSRSEWTDVECERRVAGDNSSVEFVRLDTGEVLETEPVTEADRQMELDELTAEVDQQLELKKARDQYDEARERIAETPNPEPEQP